MPSWARVSSSVSFSTTSAMGEWTTMPSGGDAVSCLAARPVVAGAHRDRAGTRSRPGRRQRRGPVWRR